MITQASKPTEALYAPTRALPSFTSEARALLGVGVAFVVCLAAIGAGVWLTLTSGSHGVAVLAALACAGVIYGLLSPRRV